MLFPYSKKVIALAPQVYSHISSRYIKDNITYIINSKYRQARTLTTWLEEQVQNPSKEVISFADSIDSSTDYDVQIINILRKVRATIKYKTDSSVYGMDEYWQTAFETITKLTGDCEDGAILIYVLARLKGIPVDRVYILCGDVEDPMHNNKVLGHAFLGYRPNYYPLNWAIIDWCYYVDTNIIEDRHLFTIQGKKFYEYIQDGSTGKNVPSRYKSLWFLFNEHNAHSELIYRSDI